MVRSSRLLALAVATLLCAPPLLAADDIEEEWFVARLEGQPVGTLQVVAQPRENGGYTVRATQRLRFKRVQTTIDIGVTQVFEEDADGKFSGFTMRQELARNAIEVAGEVRDGRLYLRERSAGGAERTHEIEVPDDAVGAHRSEKILCEKLSAFVEDPSSPSVVETVLFLPELRRFGKQTTRFGPLEEVTVAGKPRRLHRVEVTQDALPGLTITQWVNADCEEERFIVPVLGMEFVYERTSREDALATDLRSPPEILVSSAVRVDRRVPRGTVEARYRIRFDSSVSGRDWREGFSAPGQEVVEARGDAIVLVVRRVTPPETRGRAAADPDRPGYVEEDLAANAYIQSDDPAIRKLAREVVGDVEDPWEAARSLEEWVHKNLTEKNLETAFATAREVLESREGDCTEHAVLLAALCRAADVPARVVAGLVYHDGAFIGHMWTQVHAGKWIPLDATLGRGAVDADHIALSSSALGTGSLSELFIDLVQVLGRLQIEVLETK